MATTLLGHRALFGKGIRFDKTCEALQPYHREEVLLVLTSLAALLADKSAEEQSAQRAMVHAFFLESAAKVEPKVKPGSAIFHRRQVLAGIQLAMLHCRGDRATQPAGTGFFEGIARILTTITDHLSDPKPPRIPAKADTRTQLLLHLNHLLRLDPIPRLEVRQELVRAHHLLFERGPKLSARHGFNHLAGSFHERHGVQCERWFATALHLLAKTLDYSLATMHSHQPVVRIASDFRGSPLEARQVERLFAPLRWHARRSADEANDLTAPLNHTGGLRARPVLRVLEDTFAAADPHLLAEALTTHLGSRLVGENEDHDAARRAWTALVCDHVLALLPTLTGKIKHADLAYRCESGRERQIADWFHVKGSDALLVFVVTAPMRRDFRDDEHLATANGRLASELERAARGVTMSVADWQAGRCAPGGKRFGQIKRVFPLIVLEQDIPQDAALHRLLAKLFKEEGLLTDAKIQPLTTVGVGLMEALASTSKPPSLLALVAKRASGASKSKPVSEFAAKQGLPTSPDPEAMVKAYEKLVRAMRKMLGIK